MNLLQKLTKNGSDPVQTPEQAQGLGNLSVGRMLKPTDKALLPSNAQQVATLNLPVLTRENFGKKPISAKDVKAMQTYASIVRSTVANGIQVLDEAADMKEQEAKLAQHHAKYLTRVAEAETRVQQSNVRVGVAASKSAVAHHRLGLHLQNAIGSAKTEIALNTAQYQASCAW